MIADQLTAIRRDVEGAMAVRDAATPGPWKAAYLGFNIVHEADDGNITTVVRGVIDREMLQMIRDEVRDEGECYLLTGDNRNFIAHSRTDPTHAHALALLDEVERLQRELAELKGGS